MLISLFAPPVAAPKPAPGQIAKAPAAEMKGDNVRISQPEEGELRIPNFQLWAAEVTGSDSGPGATSAEPHWVSTAFEAPAESRQTTSHELVLGAGNENGAQTLLNQEATRQDQARSESARRADQGQSSMDRLGDAQRSLENDRLESDDEKEKGRVRCEEAEKRIAHGEKRQAEDDRQLQTIAPVASPKKPHTTGALHQRKGMHHKKAQKLQDHLHKLGNIRRINHHALQRQRCGLQSEANRLQDLGRKTQSIHTQLTELNAGFALASRSRQSNQANADTAARNGDQLRGLGDRFQQEARAAQPAATLDHNTTAWAGPLRPVDQAGTSATSGSAGASVSSAFRGNFQKRQSGTGTLITLGRLSDGIHSSASDQVATTGKSQNATTLDQDKAVVNSAVRNASIRGGDPSSSPQQARPA